MQCFPYIQNFFFFFKHRIDTYVTTLEHRWKKTWYSFARLDVFQGVCVCVPYLRLCQPMFFIEMIEKWTTADVVAVVSVEEMNLHWAGTLSHHRLSRKNKPKQNQTITVAFPYNYTEYQLSKEKQYWDGFYQRHRTANNHSALYADNKFMKKTSVLSDMMERSVHSQSFTTVIVIASIFLFFTLAITVAVVIFCRKKNTVFALQKSEQEDVMEMDDFNSDAEGTDTEYDSEIVDPSSQQCSRSLNRLDPKHMDSPSRYPLVSCHQRRGSDLDESPQQSPSRRLLPGHDERGEYQRVVVTALLENTGLHSDSEDSGSEIKPQYHKRLNKKYYDTAAISSDTERDYEHKSADGNNVSAISVSYADKPCFSARSRCASKEEVGRNAVTASMGSHAMSSPETQPDTHTDSHSTMPDKKTRVDACVLYVNLPMNEKDMPLPGSVIRVTMPAVTAANRGRRPDSWHAVTIEHNDGHCCSQPLSTPPHNNFPVDMPTASTACFQSPPFSSSHSTVYSHSMKPVKSLPEHMSLVAQDSARGMRYRRSESSNSCYQDGAGVTTNRIPVTPPTNYTDSVYPAPAVRDIMSTFIVSNTRSTDKSNQLPVTDLSPPRRPTLKHRPLPASMMTEGVKLALPVAPAPAPATPLDENFVLNMDSGDYCSESEVLVSRDALSLTKW